MSQNLDQMRRELENLHGQLQKATSAYEVQRLEGRINDLKRRINKAVRYEDEDDW